MPNMNKQVRLLHIVGDSKYGGASVLIERLAVETAQNGYEVSVLTTDSTFQDRLRMADIGVVDLDCIWRPIRPFRDLAGLIRLWRYLSKKRYDIVHTHTSKGGFVGRLAARLAGAPIIIHTVQGFAFHEASSRYALLLYSMLERLAAHFCDMLVMVSQFHCDWAARLRIGNERTRLAIPNGIDSTRIKPQRERDIVRADLGIRNGEIMFLTMGRLANQKGIDILLRALATLPDTVNLRVILAGDGENRVPLEQMSQKMELNEKVVFLGFRTDLGDLLRAADIVILPSLWEGLSVSLLEAMAAGKAIITTDIGSNMEVTRKGEVARIVRAGNPDELADAILDLSSNEKLREKLGTKALSTFQQTYREDIMLTKYMDLYSQLLKEKCKPCCN